MVEPLFKSALGELGPKLIASIQAIENPLVAFQQAETGRAASAPGAPLGGTADPRSFLSATSR